MGPKSKLSPRNVCGDGFDTRAAGASAVAYPAGILGWTIWVLGCGGANGGVWA